MVGWHHRLMDMSLSKLWEIVKNREAWHAGVHAVAKSRTRLSTFTFTYYALTFYIYLGLAKKFVWVFPQQLLEKNRTGNTE